MFKKTITIFTLAMCGFAGFQAIDAVSFSQAAEQQVASCGCGKKTTKRKPIRFVDENALVGCSKCKDKRLA